MIAVIYIILQTVLSINSLNVCVRIVQRKVTFYGSCVCFILTGFLSRRGIHHSRRCYWGYILHHQQRGGKLVTSLPYSLTKPWLAWTPDWFSLVINEFDWSTLLVFLYEDLWDHALLVLPSYSHLELNKSWSDF